MAGLSAGNGLSEGNGLSVGNGPSIGNGLSFQGFGTSPVVGNDWLWSDGSTIILWADGTTEMQLEGP